MLEKIDKFKVASIFYICLQFILLIKFYALGNFKLAYYFCYHAPLLFAIAFYRKDIVMIRALIIIGLVGQSTWLLDYFLYLLSGNFILGSSKFILRYHGLVYIATLFSHLFSSLLALSLVYSSDLPRRTIGYAFIYLFIFYVLNLVHIIPESYNVNYVWKFESLGVLPFQTKLYLLYIFPLSILPGYYVQLMVKRIVKKRSLTYV